MHPSELVPEVDGARLPSITSTPEVGQLDERLLGTGSRAVAIELLRGLDVETLAMERADPDLLALVDHGVRLIEMQESLTQPGSRVLAEYRFDRMHLSVVHSGGQVGSRLGVQTEGTRTDTLLDEGGSRIGRTSEAFSALFVLRPGEDGRWFIVEVRSPTDE